MVGLLILTLLHTTHLLNVTVITHHSIISSLTQFSEIHNYVIQCCPILILYLDCYLTSSIIYFRKILCIFSLICLISLYYPQTLKQKYWKNFQLSFYSLLQVTEIHTTKCFSCNISKRKAAKSWLCSDL